MPKTPLPPGPVARDRRAAWLRPRGLLVIVLWQAPVGPVPGPDGSIAFLFGSGSDEFADLSCEGNLLEARQTRYRVAGIEGDRHLSDRLRINASAGLLSGDIDGYGGPFAAAQLELKYRYFGVGAGFHVTPSLDEHGGEGMLLPSAHLRIGTGDNAHFRADVLPPIVLGAQQIARVGVGFNAARPDRFSGYLALAAIGHDGGHVGVAVDADVPVWRGAALTVRGHHAAGHRFNLTAGAVGARIVLR